MGRLESAGRASAAVFGAHTVIFLVAATGCGRLGYDSIDVGAASSTGGDGSGETGGASDGAAGSTNVPGNDASVGAGGRGGAAGSGDGGSLTASGGANGGSGGTGVATGGTGSGGTGSGGTGSGGTGSGGTGSGGTGSGGTGTGGVSGAGGAMSSGGAGGVVGTAAPVSTASQSVVGQSTLSWQHNVGSEVNAFLVVSVSLRAFAGVRTVTVTIDGSTPVSLGTRLFTNNAFVGMYGSVAPPNSIMTVNVSVNQTTSIVGGSRLYANVDPTNPVTNGAGYTAFVAPGTSIAVTVPGAVAASGTRLVDTVALAWEYPMTAGVAQTVDWNLSLSSGSQLSAGASHAAGAGSDFTFDWAFTSQSACIVANALNPAP